VLVTTRVLLRTIPEGEAGGSTRRHVDNIRSLAEQMQRLRQDLLDVALLEAGQLSIERGPVDPATLVEESLGRYATLAAEKSVNLESQLPVGLPRVLADETRLLQVFANLLTNAIKFTPAEGTVILRAEMAEQEVRFLVIDTGPGIPHENLEHLFDRFWTTRKGNPHGAGLGLAIARGIVEAHGGLILAKSKIGEGSTFSFTVPTA
jgi:signal transduction histidine kinase